MSYLKKEIQSTNGVVLELWHLNWKNHNSKWVAVVVEVVVVTVVVVVVEREGVEKE